AEIAIQSALTGHLVFSTLHTNDAASALTRLIDLGVGAFLLSSTVRGILAQRLIRVICPKCKQVDPVVISDENLRSLGLKKDTVFYKGKGCDNCANTGYYGRSGIFELLVVNDEIQQLIIKQADVTRITQAARKNGMLTLIEDGGRKIAAGVTTVNEIFRVTQEV
ncbi:MAG: ATPase, T2SS/T4P/T4SS family, partial [Smithellaceae bacterium]